ncbi:MULTISPECIES: Rpn family recombination-promoting nuclease/putative transposase [unclassified Moorena]|uniref:Rpn family recombination-promoting nuclease/putative transposase n=1 Tax=unclassified Moorena TaxID=2683338 RepID=UPI0014007D82|nr:MULTISPECIES: Rpn family recombination-promoting nuclease/putative transposase [unclassified Moorena]NEO11413.1 Rpn family recombination-promoting nuclease/putative transposase [Moorena sp. SIO3E8]NEP99250.1 Rpn family recombination-promoting nuclease/putative transposase [Moorena sp. SIO3F7]
MKTDTIFYRLFQSFSSIFFELINHSPTEAQAYQFASVEVKQLAFRIDGVFLPTTTTPEQPIYFVEVQFQRDSEFYSRFFTEIFMYLNKTKLSNDWRGVVIYPSRNVDKGATQQYLELLDSPRGSRIYLDELAETSATSVGIATVQLIVTKEDTAIAQAQDLIQRTTEEIDNEPQKRELLQLIETILVYKLPKLSRTEIEAMFSLSDLRQTKVYQEALAEGRLEGIQEGRLEGIQEGRLEGKIQGKLESIPRLLALGLTVEQVAQALELEVELVKQVLEQSTDP